MVKFEIPLALKKDNLNFVLLEKSGKKPFQISWTTKEIKYNNPELIKHLQDGGNYGVMGGGEKKLLIVDFDNKELQERILNKFPKTFTVKTGSGLLHLYFFSDEVDSFKIFDENLDTLIDVQGKGKQVVAPGSIHPNGNKYEIVNDSEISFIPYAELKALIIPYDSKKRKEDIMPQENKNYDNTDLLDVLKSDIKIESILNLFGVDTNKNPTNCPLHSSKGGKCLGWDNEVAHCFHCEGSWNIFSAVKDFKKVDFKEALEFICEKFGYEEELKKNREDYNKSLRDEEDETAARLRLEFIECVTGKDRNLSKASELLVEEILKNNYIYTTRSDEKSEIWIYKEGIYIPNGKMIIKEQLRYILKDWFSSYISNLVLNKIEADTGIDVDDFFKTKYIEEVPVKNGILNIITRELKPFNPKKVFFNKIPVTYNLKCKCLEINNFLK